MEVLSNWRFRAYRHIIISVSSGNGYRYQSNGRHFSQVSDLSAMKWRLQAIILNGVHRESLPNIRDDRLASRNRNVPVTPETGAASVSCPGVAARRQSGSSTTSDKRRKWK